MCFRRSAAYAAHHLPLTEILTVLSHHNDVHDAIEVEVEVEISRHQVEAVDEFGSGSMKLNIMQEMIKNEITKLEKETTV